MGAHAIPPRFTLKRDDINIREDRNIRGKV
jgi:hypothetical protein